jgi:hypothetical protein
MEIDGALLGTSMVMGWYGGPTWRWGWVVVVVVVGVAHVKVKG